MPWDFWLIFLFLAVLLPWRGQARLKTLLANPQVGRTQRLSLYSSTIVFQWILVAVVGWRVWVHGYTASELGLAIPGRMRIAFATVLGAALLATGQWLNLRRLGRFSNPRTAFFRALAQRIFPHSPIELLPYFALALTAGVCEEFLYRGFTMAALLRAGLPLWSVVLLSSILFGLAHLYQGRGGFVSTLVIGTVFGTARIAYDSLVPVMVWHAAVDLVAGIAGPRYLSEAPNPTSELEIQPRGH